MWRLALSEIQVARVKKPGAFLCLRTSPHSVLDIAALRSWCNSSIRASDVRFEEWVDLRARLSEPTAGHGRVPHAA